MAKKPKPTMETILKLVRELVANPAYKPETHGEEFALRLLIAARETKHV